MKQTINKITINEIHHQKEKEEGMKKILLSFSAGLVSAVVVAVLVYHLTRNDFFAGSFSAIAARFTMDILNRR